MAARRGERRRARDPGRPGARVPWARLRRDRLLGVRLCDLDLRIEGTEVAERIARVEDEMARRRIRFRPHFWISDEWFSPAGVPGVAIPFYLVHPRLLRLERREMLEAEGSTQDACMRILRHEVGHALDHAYRLHRRKEWRRVFGSASAPYPEHYQPRAYSKAYVQNLDSWYAQSHPSEDFAETFAVWLRPGSQWRRRFEGWGALRKLVYVDRLMGEIGGLAPPVRSRRRVDPVARDRRTLREYYDQKRTRYGEEYPDFYDRDLRRLFSELPEHGRLPAAAALLNRLRPEIRRAVSRWTGQYQYTIDQALKDMVDRCRTLRLRVHRPESEILLEATTLLTVRTMDYLHGGKHRLWL